MEKNLNQDFQNMSLSDGKITQQKTTPHPKKKTPHHQKNTFVIPQFAPLNQTTY